MMRTAFGTAVVVGVASPVSAGEPPLSPHAENNSAATTMKTVRSNTVIGARSGRGRLMQYLLSVEVEDSTAGDLPRDGPFLEALVGFSAGRGDLALLRPAGSR